MLKNQKREWLLFSIFGLLEGSALQYKTLPNYSGVSPGTELLRHFWVISK